MARFLHYLFLAAVFPFHLISLASTNPDTFLCGWALSAVSHPDAMAMANGVPVVTYPLQAQIEVLAISPGEVKRIQNRKGLILGEGDGKLLPYLLGKGVAGVKAVDIWYHSKTFPPTKRGSELAEYSKKYSKYLLKADARKLPVPNESQDFIYSHRLMNNLFHLFPETADEVYAETIRVLRPGGFARITGPHITARMLNLYGTKAEIRLEGDGLYIRKYFKHEELTVENLLGADGKYLEARLNRGDLVILPKRLVLNLMEVLNSSQLKPGQTYREVQPELVPTSVLREYLLRTKRILKPESAESVIRTALTLANQRAEMFYGMGSASVAPIDFIPLLMEIQTMLIQAKLNTRNPELENRLQEAIEKLDWKLYQGNHDRVPHWSKPPLVGGTFRDAAYYIKTVLGEFD